MSSQQKVETFELDALDQKSRYEDIINRYQVIREEFAYSRDGTPLITVWYIDEGP